MQDAWRTYLELAMGLTEAPRKKAQDAVRRAMGSTGATAAQLQALADELRATGAANREALTKLVRFEVERALGAVGLASADEVAELERRVLELERQLRTAGASTGAASAGGGASVGGPGTSADGSSVGTPATAAAAPPGKAVAKKAVAKKAVAKRAVAGKSTSEQVAPGKAVAQRPAKKVVAKKAVAKKTVAKKTVATKAAGGGAASARPDADGPA
ncbi:phasin family protein [Micromonospora sp. DT229]|uniref:phasin family protein n=1 Tax=Micromonospora sp. DT229 TaxID=3393430 RepID=UPI003CED41DE